MRRPGARERGLSNEADTAGAWRGAVGLLVVLLVTATCDKSSTVTGPAATPTPSLPTSLTGVIKSNRGETVEGAKVSVESLQTVSGLEGRYAIDGLHPGLTIAFVSDPCCKSVSDSITLKPGPNTLDVTLTTTCYAGPCRGF